MAFIFFFLLLLLDVENMNKWDLGSIIQCVFVYESTESNKTGDGFPYTTSMFQRNSNRIGDLITELTGAMSVMENT